MTAPVPQSPQSTVPQVPVAVLGGLLCVAVAVGGSSQHDGTGDAIAQLLALPVLAWAAWALARQPAASLRRAAIVLALLLLALPLLQLLPMPLAWQAPARVALAHDLAVAGVVPAQRWTLAPDATLRAALSMLPALALFLGSLGLSPRDARRLLALVPILAAANLLLAMAQLGVPQDSPLNPYPQWAPALGGVFANPNHQATLLVVAAVLAIGLAVDARRRARSGGAPAWLAWPWAGAAAVFFVALPLTGSRAGVIIGMLALGGVLLALGTLGLRRLRASGARRALVLAVAAIALLGLVAALGWLRHDELGDLRPQLRHATAVLAAQHAPLGSGIGSFVQVFEQEAPPSLLQYEYINHAHNEYVQWWLEGGVPALLLLAAVLGVLAAAAARLRHTRMAARAVAIPALVALLAVLLHSWVDYPLRTPGLMAVVALLAGVAVAMASTATTSSEPEQGLGLDSPEHGA